MKKRIIAYIIILILALSGHALWSAAGDPILEPGSTGITTVGTIATGTWNATAVDISSYTNLAVDANELTLTGDSLGIANHATARSAIGLGTADSPTHVTAKLTGLTDGYIPYHVADATGLADSSLTETNAATLTNNSMADTLHRHSELSASDGTPDAIVSVDADGILYADASPVSLDTLHSANIGNHLDVGNNITVGGTVDGVDVAAFNTAMTTDLMADSAHRHSELSASDGTPDQALVVNAAGQVGINKSPSYSLDVDGYSHFDYIYVGDLSIPDALSGIDYEETITFTDNLERFGIASAPHGQKTSASFTNHLIAIIGRSYLAAGNTQDWTNASWGMVGIEGAIETLAGSSGTVTGAAGLLSRGTFANAANVTNYYGLYVQNSTVYGAKLANNYGVYIEDQTGGATENYAIYSAGGINYFGAPLILGASSSQISTDTVDGSDNKRIVVVGGGIYNANRGAYMTLMGNEHTSEPGQILLGAGNVATGYIDFGTGGVAGRMRILYNGDVLIGTTVFPTANSGKVLTFGDNAADPTMDTNTAGIYAKDVTGTVEMYAVNEADAATELTSHAFVDFQPDPNEPYPWSFYSRSSELGKSVNVDMARAIRALEELTGEKFIYYADIPKVTKDIVGGKRRAWKKRWIEENTSEIRVLKADAIEQVEIEVKTEEIESYDIKWHLVDGTLKFYFVPEYEKAIKLVWQLKEGVNLDEDNGRFYKKQIPTDAEAELAAEAGFSYELPAWRAVRLNQ